MNRAASQRSRCLPARPVSIAFAAFAALVGLGDAWAGAWTRAPGNVYAKVAYGSATAAEQYTFDGRLKPYADNVTGPAFFDRSLYLYGEAGLTGWLTGVFGLSYKRVFVVDEAFRYERTRLGDARLGARIDLGHLAPLPWGLAWAVEAWSVLPTGYVRNTVPAPGAGNVDLAAQLDVGIGRGWFYAQGGVGVRLRTDGYGLSGTLACNPGVHRGCAAPSTPDPGDELLFRAEVGARPFPWLVTQGLLDTTISIAAPSIGFSVDQPTPVQQRLVKLGAGVMLRPWSYLAFEGQVFITPWGRNTVDSLDVFLGLSTEFDLGDGT